jgi:hypothetical protein
MAEPGALIGFAGPRVIEQTIRETLPQGFQRSEYLLEHGMLDMVVHRHQLRETLGRIVSTRQVTNSATRGDVDLAVLTEELLIFAALSVGWKVKFPGLSVRLAHADQPRAVQVTSSLLRSPCG